MEVFISALTHSFTIFHDIASAPFRWEIAALLGLDRMDPASVVQIEKNALLLRSRLILQPDFIRRSAPDVTRVELLDGHLQPIGYYYLLRGRQTNHPWPTATVAAKEAGEIIHQMSNSHKRTIPQRCPNIRIQDHAEWCCGLTTPKREPGSRKRAGLFFWDSPTAQVTDRRIAVMSIPE